MPELADPARFMEATLATADGFAREPVRLLFWVKEPPQLRPAQLPPFVAGESRCSRHCGRQYRPVALDGPVAIVTEPASEVLDGTSRSRSTAIRSRARHTSGCRTVASASTYARSRARRNPRPVSGRSSRRSRCSATHDSRSQTSGTEPPEPVRAQTTTAAAGPSGARRARTRLPRAPRRSRRDPRTDPRCRRSQSGETHCPPPRRWRLSPTRRACREPA